MDVSIVHELTLDDMHVSIVNELLLDDMDVSIVHKIGWHVCFYSS